MRPRKVIRTNPRDRRIVYNELHVSSIGRPPLEERNNLKFQDLVMSALNLVYQLVRPTRAMRQNVRNCKLNVGIATVEVIKCFEDENNVQA
jgi:hypothetical protein